MAGYNFPRVSQVANVRFTSRRLWCGGFSGKRRRNPATTRKGRPRPGRTASGESARSSRGAVDLTEWLRVADVARLCVRVRMRAFCRWTEKPTHQPAHSGDPA